MPKEFVPIVEAVESVIGKRPHIQTCRRWVKRGVRGIKLHAIFASGQYLTTEAYVHEFIDETTQARLNAADSQAELTKPVVAGRVSAAVKEFQRLSKSGR
jgi:hypothetical protein